MAIGPLCVLATLFRVADTYESRDEAIDKALANSTEDWAVPLIKLGDWGDNGKPADCAARLAGLGTSGSGGIAGSADRIPPECREGGELTNIRAGPGTESSPPTTTQEQGMGRCALDRDCGADRKCSGSGWCQEMSSAGGPTEHPGGYAGPGRRPLRISTRALISLGAGVDAPRRRGRGSGAVAVEKERLGARLARLEAEVEALRGTTGASKAKVVAKESVL